MLPGTMDSSAAGLLDSFHFLGENPDLNHGTHIGQGMTLFNYI